MGSRSTAGKPAKATRNPASGQRRSGASTAGTSGPMAWIIGGAVAIVGILVAVVVLVSGGGDSQNAGTVVQGNGGSWTNITADRLSTEMKSKDFTLLNVKTPYIGEIKATDLYIPYDQLAGRAAELPSDKAAKIVVYCRTGRESAIASQTLLDLGYTNIENLDGGMEAWTASGRELVNLGRN